ncbi:protein translocase subunit SecE [Mycolicibacterium chitae]|uniref:Protein translocase subunit SecE n=1 Tax=Mycolicibacterium chitae TaxID=1792 RepID=A0A3S4TPB0_MYCCI|nr:preprotein translocase subunit SecE [Mycolicibacterium chitae]MCV7108494.1 preprotein translocase subunit SecE [Mycolicibacterium chitae]BBZ00726.1 protein translocase subunit SecE [Mycolicibacterium chitae]VEG49574.1 preprotein translocase [Mycolicibacterium chitae]
MSDERDSADATGDGTEDNGAEAKRVGQTAVVTPARPTGKRSRQRALSKTGAEADTEAGGDTEDAAKTAKVSKAKKAKAASGGGILAPFRFVWTYLSEVVNELRKVIWPNRKQMVTYTTVVLLFLAFMVAMISLADIGLTELVTLVFA